MKVIESKPVVETFKLTSDPDGEATVTFRQATWEETRTRESYIGKMYGTKDGLNILDLMTREIYWTMTDANGIFDENEQPFFKFKDVPNGLQKPDYTMAEFITRIGKLPPEVVYEMRECVIKVNPQFAPQKPKEPEPVEETGE